MEALKRQLRYHTLDEADMLKDSVKFHIRRLHKMLDPSNVKQLEGKFGVTEVSMWVAANNRLVDAHMEAKLPCDLLRIKESKVFDYNDGDLRWFDHNNYVDHLIMHTNRLLELYPDIPADDSFVEVDDRTKFYKVAPFIKFDFDPSITPEEQRDLWKKDIIRLLEPVHDDMVNGLTETEIAALQQAVVYNNTIMNTIDDEVDSFDGIDYVMLGGGDYDSEKEKYFITDCDTSVEEYQLTHEQFIQGVLDYKKKLLLN